MHIGEGTPIARAFGLSGSVPAQLSGEQRDRRGWGSRLGGSIREVASPASPIGASCVQSSPRSIVMIRGQPIMEDVAIPTPKQHSHLVADIETGWRGVSKKSIRSHGNCGQAFLSARQQAIASVFWVFRPVKPRRLGRDRLVFNRFL